MPTFLAAMSPLSLIVLLVFLSGVALVVALWSLLTLGGGPKGVAVARAPKAAKEPKVAKEPRATKESKIAREPRARVRVKKDEPQPLPSNRFMKQPLEPDLDNPDLDNEDLGNKDIASELPTDHVSRSRVRILKTLEPDPELETPAFKPTTYDQMVNRQRVPKTGLPKMNVPKTGLPTDALRSESKPAKEVTPPRAPLEKNVSNVAPPATPPRKITPPLPSDSEDTSTQPSLFETGRRSEKNKPGHLAESSKAQEAPNLSPPMRQPSVQREESEAAFRASQNAAAPNKPKAQSEKTQQEKDQAFENFLRKSDDLGF